MASTTVLKGERGAHAKTLAASTVDTVTINRDCDKVEVYVDTAAAKVYFTVDGSTPTVAGQNTYEVVGQGKRIVSVPTAAQTTVVKLISAGTPIYSVLGDPI